MSTSYYQLLGIRTSATVDEIKKSYKKLAVKYHPDKTEDKSHHELFLRISEAYTTLVDPELRRAYDAKAGILLAHARTTPKSSGTESASFRYTTDDYTNPFRYSRGSATDTFRTGFRPSYFEFFRLSNRGPPDSNDRGARYKTSYATPAEDDSLLAARLAQRKMKEAMERRRQEFIDEVQRKKYAEEERLRRYMQNVHGSTHYSSRFHTGTEGHNRYEWGKYQAHQRAWSPNHPVYEDIFDGDPAEPIVVEDEEEPDVEEQDDENGDEDSGNPETTVEDINDSDNSVDLFQKTDVSEEQQTEPPLNIDEDASFATAESTANPASTNTPDVVEVAEDGNNDQSFIPEPLSSPLRGPSASPRRMAREATPHIKAQISKSINERMGLTEKEHVGFQAVPNIHNGAKKAKFSNFEAMKESLGTTIDDVDFTDFRETLPNSGGRSPRRQSSRSDPYERPSKKAKVSEYTNGSSKAQTLFTPVNASYARKSLNTISVSDLTPQNDDSKLIFTHSPPHIDLNKITSREEWHSYVNLVNEYQHAFTGYREAVLNFQVDRLKKDVRHHNIIYSDNSCLDVYQTCLFNDALLLQNLNRSMQEFRETIKEFNSNCVKVKSGYLDFQFSV